MATETWGELERGNLSVGVTRMPWRKSVCVTVRRGSVIYTTAYCRSDEEAQRLWDALVELTRPVTRHTVELGRTIDVDGVNRGD